MRKRQQGSAMIVVVCVMVVTIALSLALLLSASVLSMNAIRSNQKEQCRISAISMSEALRDEIEAAGTYPTKPQVGGDTSTLAGKLHTVYSSDWVQYWENVGSVQQIQIDAKGIYTYQAEHESMPSTKFTVQMYWMHEAGIDPEAEELAPVLAEKFNGVTLYIKVTCQVGEEASTIISTYIPDPESIQLNSDNTDFSWKWSYNGHEWEG